MSATDISGLGTLLTGAYIELEPGTGPQGPLTYVGLETPPPTNRNVPPAVATDAAGDSVVVWASTDGLGMSGVFGRRLGSQGRANGLKFRIDGGGNPRGTGDYAPAIAMSDDGAFVVAWSQANGAPAQLPNVHAIQARRYGPLGVPGPIVAISETRALEEANVDMNAAGDAVVTWAATPAESGRLPLRVQAQTLLARLNSGAQRASLGADARAHLQDSADMLSQSLAARIARPGA